MVRLVSIPGEQEILKPEHATRPHIALETASVVLGRSRVTGINDATIARQICRVDPVNRTVRGIRDTSTYSLNGVPVQGTAERSLTEGDIIGLEVVPEDQQKHSQYLYEIQFEPDTGNDGTAPSAAAEEFACACCLEIMVKATSLVPCGHSFCAACCAKQAPSKSSNGASASVWCCPQCRTPVTTQVPCRTLDQAIAALVQHEVPVFFDPKDVVVYRDRTNVVFAGTAQSSATRTTTTKTSSKRRQNRSGWRQKRARSSPNSNGRSIKQLYRGSHLHRRLNAPASLAFRTKNHLNLECIQIKMINVDNTATFCLSINL